MDSFDCFALIMVILFYAAFLFRTLQLVLIGTNPIALGVGKAVWRSMMEISFGVCLIIWTIEVIAHSSRLDIHIFRGALISPLFTLLPLRITGAVLIVAGYAVFVFALKAFGNSWRIGIDKKKAGNLITNGIFSFTRNPIFLFMDMYFIGTWLIYSNIFFLLLAVMTVIGIHFHILEEERFLLAKYGTEYKSYMKKVRRYF